MQTNRLTTRRPHFYSNFSNEIMEVSSQLRGITWTITVYHGKKLKSFKADKILPRGGSSHLTSTHRKL